MNKKILLSLLLILLVVTLLDNSSALLGEPFSTTGGTASFVNYGSSFNKYYSGDRINTYWPILKDPLSCQARQDVLIQISPAGCQPAVVRSDLLAEQNVPVFCQLSALQLNPAIDIKQIRNIRFGGNYPPEVAGVGFHPANAGLRTTSNLIGSPIDSNIGYVVVVLKQMPDERNLPELLKFTLQASIEYYAGNSLGIGKTEFLLQESTKENWEKNERNKDTFLRGGYSVRLVNSNPEVINIEIYKGDFKFSEVQVERTKESREIYLPDLYCQSSLKFSYNDYISPDIIARLQVDDDVLDVVTGSKFLNEKCSVRKIAKDVAGGGSVDVNCGKETFTLRILDRVLEIGKKFNYFGSDDKLKGVWVLKQIDNENSKYIISSEDGKKEEKVNFGELVPLEGERFIEDKKYKGIDDYFNLSIENYGKVTDDYSNEKKQGNDESFGEKSLVSGILLASRNGKLVTESRLIDEYLRLFPNGNNAENYRRRAIELNAKDFSNAGFTLELDNDFRYIRLLELKEPTKKSSAKVIWGGKSSDKILVGSTTDIYGKSGDVTRKLTLDNVIDANRVKVTSTCIDSNNKAKNEIVELKLNDKTKKSCDGEILEVRDIDLQNFIKLKINPTTRSQSTTNFTVGVGIEKRALELTPQKARKKINNLNETIKKWESISDNLGKVIKPLKAACLTTALGLTVKNFLTGLSGEALARQQVMQGDDGWNKKCEALINQGKYKTVFECINKNSDDVGKDIDARVNAIGISNEFTKGIENKYSVKGSGDFFGGGSFDDEKAKADLLVKINNECRDVGFSENRVGDKKNVGELLSNANVESLSYQGMRDLYFNCLVSKGGPGIGVSSEVGKNRAQAEIDKIGSNMNDRITFDNKVGVYSGVDIYFLDNKRGQYSKDVTKKTLTGQGYDLNVVNGGENTPVQIVKGKQELYIVSLDKTDKGYQTNKIYKLEGKKAVSEYTEKTTLKNSDLYGLPSLFDEISAGNYFNSFAPGEAEVRYFDTEPYKGMPALVPFDLDKGFYAATTQSLPLLGNTKSFESNGRPTSFYVCNIMKDKRVGFYQSNFGDDRCVQFNYYTGQEFNKFPGLNERDTRDLVARATTALREAAEQYGKKQVRILGKTLNVGQTAAIIPGSQCTDHMSPGDCQLLFNLCDPVICPASRCNFGGDYYVADVIQSGIVGSALLCLPNINEGVYLPVCLTGIKAGIDSLVSVLKSHQQCLQENIDSGRYVGICDQTTGVYLCDFFWKQAKPIADLVVPKLFELASGESGHKRGGGEYLTVQSSWQNAQESVNYITDFYAVNSIEAFKSRNYEEAGSEFCRAFISAKGPKTFEALIEPDSPPQFHAWYSELSYTDATIPATSQYKVFYHIYSGNDFGTGFNVYLKDPPQGVQYQANNIITVANGFIPKGEFATETRDFTAPKGYKQLCVSINGKEECGFKQVSSSFAVNYVRDELVKDELLKQKITSEKECISGGSFSASSLLNTNLQDVANDAINPSVYNRGIVRVCATENPGLGTDESRFVKVGICGIESLRCWLDKKSVENALTEDNRNLTETTLSELKNRQINDLQKSGKFDSEEVIDTRIKEFSTKIKNANKEDVNKIDGEIDSVLIRTLFNYQKAELWMLKAELFGGLFDKLARILDSTPKINAQKSEDIITDNDKIRDEGDGKVYFGLKTEKEFTYLTIGGTKLSDKQLNGDIIYSNFSKGNEFFGIQYKKLVPGSANPSTTFDTIGRVVDGEIDISSNGYYILSDLIGKNTIDKKIEEIARELDGKNFDNLNSGKLEVPSEIAL